MLTLTARQQQILALIAEFIDTEGMPPTRAEIAEALGFRSPNAAEDHLKALERKGAIEIMAGTSRGIRLLTRPNTGLPVVGRVAAGNPFAWFPVERSAEELVEPTAANRMIAYPYTKYLNAVLTTDQAAALLLCSEEAADAFGIPPSQRVYWLGGAYTRGSALALAPPDHPHRPGADRLDGADRGREPVVRNTRSYSPQSHAAPEAAVCRALVRH